MNTSLFLLRLSKLWKISTSAQTLHAALFFRVFAAVEHAPVLKQALKSVVDIGANNGQFALAARRYTSAKVHCFEPLTSAHSKLKRLFRHEAEMVVVYPYAIGKVSGVANINVAGRSDSSSLLEIGAEQVRQFPGTGPVGIEKIQVRRLSDCIAKDELKSPALLKIDVQGYEFTCLEGCSDVLDCFDYVYCECSFVELYVGQALASEIIGYLANHGLRFAGVYNSTYGSDGRCLQADLLFARECD